MGAFSAPPPPSQSGAARQDDGTRHPGTGEAAVKEQLIERLVNKPPF